MMPGNLFLPSQIKTYLHHAMIYIPYQWVSLQLWNNEKSYKLLHLECQIAFSCSVWYGMCYGITELTGWLHDGFPSLQVVIWFHNRDHFVYAPSQREVALQCYGISLYNTKLSTLLMRWQNLHTNEILTLNKSNNFVETIISGYIHPWTTTDGHLLGNS